MARRYNLPVSELSPEMARILQVNNAVTSYHHQYPWPWIFCPCYMREVLQHHKYCSKHVVVHLTVKLQFIHLLWQGRIQDFFFRRGCTRLLPYFNTNKPLTFFFCRIPVLLENRRSSRGGGGWAPHAPTP